MILTIEMRSELGIRQPKDGPFEEIEALMIMCRYEGIHPDNESHELWLEIHPENWRQQIRDGTRPVDRGREHHFDG